MVLGHRADRGWRQRVITSQQAHQFFLRHVPVHGLSDPGKHLLGVAYDGF